MSLMSTIVIKGESLKDLSDKLNKELLKYDGKEVFDIKFLSEKSAVIILRN